MPSSRKYRTSLCGVLIIASFVVSGLAPARSQNNASESAGGPTWASKITDTLILNGPQQAAFSDYMAAMAAKSAQSPGVSVGQLRAMTTPERLDYMADRMTRDLAVLKARSRAAHRFYGLLSAAQRKTFDAAMTDVATQSEPDAADYNSPSWTAPDWLIKPSAETISRFYPTAAQAKRIPGKVRISCLVDIDGYLLNCVVVSEEPKDLGFGNAALQISAYFRMRPATLYGAPVRSPVTVPVAFSGPLQH
jgi:TonB family protein